MFQALRSIGGVVASSKSAAPSLPFCEPVGENYNRLLAVTVTSEGDYRGSELRELGEDERCRLPYKGAVSKAKHDPLPVTRLTDTRKRAGDLAKCMADAAKITTDPAANERFKAISECLHSNVDQIASDMQAQCDGETSEDVRVVVALAYPSGELVAEDPAFQQVFEEHIRERYGARQGKSLTRTEGECYCCGSEARVFGNFSELKSYILDQPGAIAGGFRIRQAAHNMPICRDCISLILKGYYFVQRHLNFRMAGLSYLLIPTASDPSVLSEALDIVRVGREERADTLSRKRLNRLTEDEKEIMALCAEHYGESDAVTLRFVFYEGKPGSARWRIHADICSVLPSRLRRVFDAKDASEEDVYKLFKMQKTDKAPKLGMRVVRNFAARAGELKGAAERDFLRYAEAIFRGSVLSKAEVLGRIMNVIATAYKQNEFPTSQVQRGLLFLSFLDRLGIISWRSSGGAKEVQMASKGQYEEFLATHRDFLGVPEKRVAFLSGCLVAKVLYSQRSKKGAKKGQEPFLKKLGGMRMDRSRLQQLLAESEMKLNQYESAHLASGLLQTLSENWLNCPDDWTLASDETTFYFVLGLNLDFTIAGQKKAEEVSQDE